MKSCRSRRSRPNLNTHVSVARRSEGSDIPCSHALRGNTRPGRSASRRLPSETEARNDAERRRRHSHAERGNEKAAQRNREERAACATAAFHQPPPAPPPSQGGESD